MAGLRACFRCTQPPLQLQLPGELHGELHQPIYNDPAFGVPRYGLRVVCCGLLADLCLCGTIMGTIFNPRSQQLLGAVLSRPLLLLIRTSGAGPDLR